MLRLFRVVLALLALPTLPPPLSGALALAAPGAPAASGAAACRLRFWQLLAGVEHAAVAPPCIPAAAVRTDDRRIHLVRLDPSRARLIALATSSVGGDNLTAAAWARRHRLAVVVNLGMYQGDHRTHAGYARVEGHVTSGSWVDRYQSVLLLHPLAPRGPAGTGAAPGPGELADLPVGAAARQALLQRHHTVVQNLRLIRSDDGRRGINVWSPATAARRWSEAALAQDREGRLIIVFSRAPYAMHELNELLLRLPLGVVRAQHLEGGPEASLSIHAGGLHLDLCGSYETGFREADSNVEQWPLPNVLGVASGPR